ncbi:MAG: NPCBM/NEW2 domain-containing protein [Clostridiales bacterium]|nr:NPCBM/NEW2 domain-containing protein [Clostridiales bacterium]
MKPVLKKIMSAGLAAALTVGMVPAISASAVSSQFAGEAWYDQIETVEINREAAHSSFIPYESAEKALTNEKSVLDDLDASGSEYYQLLNGTWSFYFSSNVTERLKNVTGSSAVNYTENWDTTGWDTIEVPSNIQTQTNEDGSYKYDMPIYTNQSYAWSNYETVNYTTAPTTNNSVGQYKRTFTLPDSWDGRQVFVSFQGVQSAFYLYINGQMVGYGEDSYTADEFNITSYLQEGENTIAVEVYRWSTGSYLENQDYIDLSGIFRDVYLYSKDDVEIRDIFATTDLNDDYTQATVNVSVDVKNLAAGAGDYTVEAQLYDADDNAVWSSPISMTASVEAALTDVAALADDTGVTVSASMEVDNPELWFADTPYLYRLLVQLKDSDGNVLENAVIRIGIREVGTATINSAGQQQIQINGEKVLLRGVNRHESSAENGRALTNEEILTDVQLMKSFNVNAIRTSHYPNNTYLYDLADELGLYICDEANIESHLGAIYSNIPSGDSTWNTSVMDRTMNMVERDKNHASVIIWSLGNEATYSTYTMDESYCFYNSSQWILERDPSRLRKYERDNRYTEGSREDSMVDLYSSQYWSVDSVVYQLENTSNKLPYIQSEYAHSMGNGLGNLAEYWEVFREYDNANGGFIWDWIDQALYAVNEDGETYLAYGGDWGETVTDYDFCANGMVNADRTPSSELYEAKKVLQEISFYDDGNIENGEVRIVNEFLNTNLNEYQVTWTYTEDNTVIASGELTGEDINIAAGESKTIQVSLPDVTVTEGSDYVLTFSVALKEDTAWANEYGGKAGDEIAFEQFELGLTATENQPSMDASSMDEMAVTETDTAIAFTGTTEDGADYSIAIDKTTGYITDYIVDGTALLTSGPEPNYWRAATSNDAGAGVASTSSNLKDAADYYKINEVTVEQHEKVVYVTISGVISNTNSEEILQYAVYADGTVTVTNTFTPSSSCDTLSRVGMKMTVAAGLETVTYYGKGEQANYSDRNTGAKLDVYSTTVTDLFESKLVNPQENGNRTGTRWVSLMDDENQIGLLISAEDTMEFTALHYTAEDMANSSHPYELTKLDETILTVDYAQRGLGNASCGPDTLSAYQLPTGTTYTHTYSIRPITGTTSTAEDFVDSCMELSNLNVNSAEPISAITVDGTALEDFKVGTSDYTYERAYTDGMTSPVIGVITTSDDVEVSIEQIDGYNGTATITTTSAYGITAVYTVTVSTVQREYLSDMEWTENVSGYFANSRDVCDSNPIQLSVNGETITYSKGVGMHAPASITVDISGLGYTTFSAVAGINYESVADNNGYSNVNLVVLVDGAEAFRADNIGYNSSGNVFSVPVEVDVTGASTVTVKVEQGDYDYNDHVSWASARFTAAVEEPACSHESTELVNVKEPTCTEDGYTGDTVCATCGETISAGEVIPAMGHSWDSGMVTKEATCTEAGEKNYTCAVCGESYTEVIPATGHSYVSEITKEATCTEDGIMTYTCSSCGDSYAETIPATGHSWDNGVVTKEATTEEEGIITYTCTACGETKTEAVTRILLVPSVSLSVTTDGAGHLILSGTFEDYENAENYYAVTSHGFVYYSTTKLGNRTLTINTSGRTRVNFSKYTSDGGYSYTMTPANGNTKYTIRAFLAYTNASGKTVYVYSDPINVSYNSLLAQ